MGDNTDCYLTSYEDLEIHRLMLEDKPRTDAYRNAILSNKQLFKNKVVLDVGAGTGVLSIFCAQAGASKVYAVEVSDVAKLCQKIIDDNSFNEIIEVCNCRIEDLDLPVKVDIIVSEWMGFYLLHEGMLDSVIFARDKFLKENGLLFPEECIIYTAPCELPSFFQNWDDIYNVKMKSFGEAYRKLFEGKPEIRLVEKENLFHEGSEFFKFNLNKIGVNDLNKISKQQFVTCNRNGMYHGITLWFSVKFPAVDDTTKVTLSTEPSAPPTHWKQTVIVLPVGNYEVMEDTTVGWDLTLQRSLDKPRSYQIQLIMLDPETASHPIPCDCLRPKCRIIKVYLSQCPDEEDNEDDDINCNSNDSN